MFELYGCGVWIGNLYMDQGSKQVLSWVWRCG